MIVGYAPSWIPQSHLEVVEFLPTTLKYLQSYPHIGLQHQFLFIVIISI
jgi:hypothetical protein